MVAVMLYQRDQEGAGRLMDIRIIKAQPRKSSRRTAFGDGAVHYGTIASQVPGMSIFSKGPFRSTSHQLFEHNLDSVFGRQVHDPVVIREVVLSRRHLDSRPHEPVA